MIPYRLSDKPVEIFNFVTQNEGVFANFMPIVLPARDIGRVNIPTFTLPHVWGNSRIDSGELMIVGTATNEFNSVQGLDRTDFYGCPKYKEVICLLGLYELMEDDLFKVYNDSKRKYTYAEKKFHLTVMSLFDNNGKFGRLKTTMVRSIHPFQSPRCHLMY